MEGLWQDLRYAVRLLRRTPRNSAIAAAAVLAFLVPAVKALRLDPAAALKGD